MLRVRKKLPQRRIVRLWMVLAYRDMVEHIVKLFCNRGCACYNSNLSNSLANFSFISFNIVSDGLLS